MKNQIYLDYHATTPVDPQVLEAMLPYFTLQFGNPASSSHSYGWQAEAAVERARTQVAEILAAKDKEIIFTSGATESNNLALFGGVGKVNGTVPHLIVSQVEHSCVLAIAKELQARGVEVTFLPVNQYGQVTVDQLQKYVKPNTKLISLIFANNEIGTINPIHEIGQFTRSRGILLHVDAAQAVGKVPIDVNELNIDLLSLSGHKVYGPKGVGALFVKSKEPRAKISPLIFGGGQERGIRPGTLNVPGIVGLGRACEIARSVMSEELPRLKQLRDHLQEILIAKVPDVKINGHPTERLAINLNISFAGCLPDLLSQSINRLAVSSGSACSSTSLHASHVLTALGLPEDIARCTIRFGLGRFTTEQDIDEASQIVIAAIAKCRQIKVPGMSLLKS